MSKFVILDILLKEPVKTDLTYIQGSTVRGAYIRKYMTKNNIQEDIAINEEYRDKLLSNKIKFFNAYPYVDDKCCIPTPLCFYTSKEESKKFGKETNNVNIENEFEEGVTIGEGYQRINKKEFSLVDSSTLKLFAPQKVENLHTRKIKVSKDGEKPEKDTGDLFRYTSIDKNQRFYSVIQCDEDVVEEVKNIMDNEIVYLGGSKGSGYGRCEIKVSKIVDYNGLKNTQGISYNDNQINIDNKKVLSIYFVSDAIIKNEYGQICSHIDPEDIEKYLNISDVKYSKSSVLTTETKGYNATIRTSLPSVTAIKSGSILTYTYNGELDKDDINNFEMNGIGSRKEEGYGRVVVNPSFEVKTCEFYKEQENKIYEEINLDKNGRKTLSRILNTVNKERTSDALTKIALESIDSKYKKDGSKEETKKVVLNLSQTQVGRLINLLNECEKEENDEKAKNMIISFRDELKTKTKRDYSNKSRNRLFGCPLYIDKNEKNTSQQDYFDVLVGDMDIAELTNATIQLNNINREDLNLKQLNNFRLKLRLTQEILAYQLRKEVKKDEK